MNDKITLRIEENPVIVRMSQEGPQGPQGPRGNGIVSIAKSATSGNVDTYTITLTDGTTSTFTVTNGNAGNGISSVVKTSTSGLVDTYTITFTDGATTTFTVANGGGTVTYDATEEGLVFTAS